VPFQTRSEVLTVYPAAHGDAYEKASVLHRDISPGNIMITSDGRGFLIDWDLAKSSFALSLGQTVCAYFNAADIKANWRSIFAGHFEIHLGSIAHEPQF
jgi:serine/threonine protein kinase